MGDLRLNAVEVGTQCQVYLRTVCEGRLLSLAAGSHYVAVAARRLLRLRLMSTTFNSGMDWNFSFKMIRKRYSACVRVALNS